MYLMQRIPLDKMFYLPAYNITRRSKIILFAELLSKQPQYAQLSLIEKTQLLFRIEQACVVHCKDNSYIDGYHWDDFHFAEMYNLVCYRVSSNLETGGMVGNPNFAKQLLSGELHIEQLPQLTSIEMFPQKYTGIIDQIELSKNTQLSVKTSSMYKCRKCHQSKTTLENLYNRSLDEGVNIAITCLNCGFKWTS
jgi:DNA-directed RNA polymerase subunit M/transcription elongation factor TFIIS